MDNMNRVIQNIQVCSFVCLSVNTIDYFFKSLKILNINNSYIMQAYTGYYDMYGNPYQSYKRIQYQSHFCSICGDFTISQIHTPPNATCNCETV